VLVDLGHASGPSLCLTTGAGVTSPLNRGGAGENAPGDRFQRIKRVAGIIMQTSGFCTTGFSRMPTGRHLGHRGPSIADKARTARAVAEAADLAPIIADLRTAGVTSLKGIAKALNDRRVPTPAGGKCWCPMQVARVLKRLAG
jgi:hypothetical protein